MFLTRKCGSLIRILSKEPILYTMMKESNREQQYDKPTNRY